MNPLSMIVALNRKGNAALDRAERIMLSTLDDLDTLEPGDTDRHGNKYASEEFERLDELKDALDRQNIIYIKGVAYQLSSYGEPYSDGSRKATLRVWKPF